jgi:hypothetical protein
MCSFLREKILEEAEEDSHNEEEEEESSSDEKEQKSVKENPAARKVKVRDKERQDDEMTSNSRRSLGKISKRNKIHKICSMVPLHCSFGIN